MARLNSATHFKENDHQLFEARGCDSFESFRDCLTVDFAHHRCFALVWRDCIVALHQGPGRSDP